MGMKTFLNRFRSDDRGAVIPFAALSMTVLTTALMYAYNTGRVASDRIKLQNVADNAAISAALAEANVLSSVAYNNQGIAYLYGKLIRENSNVVTYSTQANFAFLAAANKTRWSQTGNSKHEFNQQLGLDQTKRFNMVGEFADHPHKAFHKTKGKLWESGYLNADTDQALLEGFYYLAREIWWRQIPQYRKELGVLIRANQTALAGLGATAADTAHRVAYRNLKETNLRSSGVHIWSVVDPYVQGASERLEVGLTEAHKSSRPFFRWATWDEFVKVALPPVIAAVPGSTRISPDYYDYEAGGPPVDTRPDTSKDNTFFYTVACWEPWDWMHGENPYVEKSGDRFHNLTGSDAGEDAKKYKGGKNNPTSGHWHYDRNVSGEKWENWGWYHGHMCRGKAPKKNEVFAVNAPGCRKCTPDGELWFSANVAQGLVNKGARPINQKQTIYGVQYAFPAVWIPYHAAVRRCYGHWIPVDQKVVDYCQGKGPEAQQFGWHQGDSKHQETSVQEWFSGSRQEHKIGPDQDSEFHHREYHCTLCNVPVNGQERCLLSSQHVTAADSVQYHGYDAFELMGSGYSELEGGGRMIRLYLSEIIEHFDKGGIPGRMSFRSQPGIPMLVDEQFWRAWEVERPNSKKPKMNDRYWLPDEFATAAKPNGKLPVSFTPLIRAPDEQHFPVVVAVMANSPKSPWMPSLFAETTMVAVAAAQVRELERPSIKNGEAPSNLYNPNWDARLVAVRTAVKEILKHGSVSTTTPWRGENYRSEPAQLSGSRVTVLQEMVLKAIKPGESSVEALH